MKTLLILFLFVLTAVNVRSSTLVSQRDCDGIRGRVTTPEGWLIPRARISLRNKPTRKNILHKQTDQNAGVETDENGEYRVCPSPGTYDITVTSPGFKIVKRAIKFDGGGSITIDFPMKRGKPVTDQAITQ